MQKNFSLTQFFLTLILFLMVVFNTVLIFDVERLIKKQEDEYSEKTRPANVELITVTPEDCPECADLAVLLNELRARNIKITKEESLQVNDDRSVELIAQYNITKTPTFILTGELEKNADVKEFLNQFGIIENGTFIAREIMPPYFDPVSGQVRGKFNVVYLTDKTCSECYDATFHRQALSNLSMFPVEEKFVDRSEKEGRDLIAKYKVETLPTIFISGDLEEYVYFREIWPQVGKIAEDGTYIFTTQEVMGGSFRDLKTGKIQNSAQ